MARLVKKEQKKFPSLKVMKKNKAAVGCSPKVSGAFNRFRGGNEKEL